MKACPECGADVEGLLYRCDCCGARLTATNSFFVWYIFVTEASGDISLNEIFQEFEEIDSSQFSSFLQKIEVSVYCYPDAMLTELGIKNRVYFSAARKKAILTIVLNYDDYVCAARNRDKKKKAELIAAALLQGIYKLQIRLEKAKLCIDAIVEHAEGVLGKYLH